MQLGHNSEALMTALVPSEEETLKRQRQRDRERSLSCEDTARRQPFVSWEEGSPQERNLPAP